MTSAEEMRSQAVSPVSTLGGAEADSAASAAVAMKRPSIGSRKNILLIRYPLLKIAKLGLRRKRSIERLPENLPMIRKSSLIQVIFKQPPPLRIGMFNKSEHPNK
jgi:hypothetical protein